jgi:hypothetical protein
VSAPPPGAWGSAPSANTRVSPSTLTARRLRGPPAAASAHNFDSLSPIPSRCNHDTQAHKGAQRAVTSHRRQVVENRTVRLGVQGAPTLQRADEAVQQLPARGVV